MLPKVTFSILCYNYGQYLEQAIRSCLSQQVDDLETEVLIINDGSTDNTEEVCSHFAHQIKVVNEGNKGFPSSLTRAIQYATGDYVFLLDADDYFLDGKLAAFLPHFICGKLYVHDFIIPFYSSELSPRKDSMPGGCTSTIAVNRKAALDLLPVENELSFQVINQMGHGLTVESAYTVYRFHNESMTIRNVPGKQNEYLAGITHRLANRIEQLLKSNEAPYWFLPNGGSMKVAATYKAQAFYNELEAALENKERLNSFNACLKMLNYAYSSREGLKMFHFKMVIKTLLGRPSFQYDFIEVAGRLPLHRDLNI